MKFCALFYLSPFLPFSLRIHYESYFDDAKFSEKSHRNIRVPWLIIGIRSERKKCGSLKICRLFLGCTDYRMSNERYVMYFWEGFKMHTLFCAPLSAGFHRPIGVGWSLERQHLFSREGLPLFHLHSRLLSLPLLPGLRLASFSKALVDRTADRKIIATLIFFLLPFCSD